MKGKVRQGKARQGKARQILPKAGMLPKAGKEQCCPKQECTALVCMINMLPFAQCHLNLQTPAPEQKIRMVLPNYATPNSENATLVTCHCSMLVPFLLDRQSGFGNANAYGSSRATSPLNWTAGSAHYFQQCLVLAFLERESFEPENSASQELPTPKIPPRPPKRASCKKELHITLMRDAFQNPKRPGSKTWALRIKGQKLLEKPLVVCV